MTERSADNDDVRAFLGRFRELYKIHRFGATYVFKRPKDIVLVKRLLEDFDVARLEQLAVELLTCDDEWVNGTDRGIGILTVKASWLDGRLCERAAKAAAPKRPDREAYVPLRFRA